MTRCLSHLHQPALLILVILCVMTAACSENSQDAATPAVEKTPSQQTRPTHEADQIRIQLDTAHSFNGYDDVNRNVFGIFVPGRSQADERLKHVDNLNAGLVRIHPDIHRLGWQDKDNPGQLDPRVFDYENEQWMAEWKQQNSYELLAAVESNLADSNVVLLLGSLPQWLVKDSDFRNRLRTSGKAAGWGWTSHPHDMEVWKEWALKHVEMFHDNPVFPKAKLAYVEILNEPSLWHYFGDREDWNDPTRPNKSMTGERMVPKYIETYVTAAKAIKEKYPDLKICGPVLHQGFTWRDNWGWNTWLKPFLQEAGEYCDVIDYHPYGHFKNPELTSFDETTDIGMTEEAIISEFNALYRYQQLHSDRIRKIMLTELNTHWNIPAFRKGNLDQATYNIFRKKQLLWIARLWRQMLDEPAKLEGVTFYHLGPSVSDQAHRKIYELLGDGLEPTGLYDFFEMLKQMQGTRLATKQSNDVKVIATRDGDQLLIWLFNDNSQPATFDLTLDQAGSAPTANIDARVSEIFMQEDGLWDLQQNDMTFNVDKQTLQADVTLPAYGMSVVRVNKPLGTEVTKTIHTKDYYGGDTMQPLPQSFTIELPQKPQGTAVLRMGLQKVKLLTPQVTINGKKIDVPKVTSAGDSNSLVEVDVPLDLLKAGNNEVTITVEGDRGSRMAFTALRITDPF